MAKITTITNPLTGQPAQVDQLDHTAQQIDDGLNIARGVSNPNLLDNWYFANPVNQRGKTEYSIVGELVYSIDRWRVSAGSSANQSAVTIDNGSLHVKLATPFGRFEQLIDNYKQLVGKQLTFTVLFEDAVAGNVYLVANQYDYQYEVACIGKRLVSLTFAITETASRLYVGIQNGDSVPVTVKPIAAKLELGDQQTLAHQDENGNWVLNEIPDYGEQLARCQRYFQTVKQFQLNIGGVVQSEGYNTASVNYQTMRETPTPSFIANSDNVIGSVINQSYIYLQDIVVQSASETSVWFCIAPTLSDGTTIHAGKVARFYELWLDADL